jgi:hypothetical protein
MERKLASIQKIIEILPIPNCDNIEMAKVLGWDLVVKKGEFKPGDYCVYFEIDSLLPNKPWSTFMEPKKFKVKTIKLRGQISQGLALPINEFPELKKLRIYEGRDLTDTLGIIKIGTKVLPKMHPFWKFFRRIWFKYLAAYWHFIFGKPSKGSQEFPTHIVSKTDECRIQSSPNLINENLGREFYISEKVDGCSTTIFTHMGDKGICSRNFRLDTKNPYSPNDTRNKIVKYFMEDLQKKYERFTSENKCVALQAELLGPGIQGNKYDLKETDLYVFQIFDTAKRETLPIKEALELAAKYGFKWVPILSYFTMDKTHDVKYFVNLSQEKSLLNKKTEREGIVIRTTEGRKVSFKAINPKFLLKHEDETPDDEGEGQE